MHCSHAERHDGVEAKNAMRAAITEGRDKGVLRAKRLSVSLR